jgi:very-short-patch-repair endonuclease
MAVRSIYSDVRRRGGIAATHELLRDGHTSHQLTAAVRSGEVVRIRQGHYGCPELSQEEQQAVRVGGRLNALSAAHFLGIWSPTPLGLDVAVPPDARALRSPIDKTVRLKALPRPGVAVTWNDPRVLGTRSVLDPLFCLDAIIRSQPAIVAFAAVESALHLGLVTKARWSRYVDSVPRRKRGRLGRVGHLSDSGGESLLKFHLLTLQLPFVQQLKVPGVGRVDFLIGECLVVEVDGAEFHTTREAFEEDRRRDALLSTLGYRVLRFSYNQINKRWPVVEAAILAAISRNDHRR